jgi:hypothetical protein
MVRSNKPLAISRSLNCINDACPDELMPLRKRVTELKLLGERLEAAPDRGAGQHAIAQPGRDRPRTK